MLWYRVNVISKIPCKPCYCVICEAIPSRTTTKTTHCRRKRPTAEEENFQRGDQDVQVKDQEKELDVSLTHNFDCFTEIIIQKPSFFVLSPEEFIIKKLQSASRKTRNHSLILSRQKVSVHCQGMRVVNHEQDNNWGRPYFQS